MVRYQKLPSPLRTQYGGGPGSPHCTASSNTWLLQWCCSTCQGEICRASKFGQPLAVRSCCKPALLHLCPIAPAMMHARCGGLLFDQLSYMQFCCLTATVRDIASLCAVAGIPLGTQCYCPASLVREPNQNACWTAKPNHCIIVLVCVWYHRQDTSTIQVHQARVLLSACGIAASSHHCRCRSHTVVCLQVTSEFCTMLKIVHWSWHTNCTICMGQVVRAKCF